MSLMLKLLAITVLSSSLLFSVTTSEKVEDFLEEQFSENRGLSSLNVEVVDIVKLDKLKDWNAYIVSVKADMKQKNKTKKIKQKMI